MNKSNTNRLIPRVSISLILFFLIIYFLNFSNKEFEFSSASEDWANFAIFLSLAVSIANLLIFYYLSIELHKYNLNKDIEEVQPIISFHLKDGDPFYTVENIGRSVALDLKIKQNFDNETGIWEEGYNYFTISPGEKIKLRWSNLSIQLGAEYKNRQGKKYYSYMDGNYLRFFDEKTPEFSELREMVLKSIKRNYKNPPKYNTDMPLMS